MYYHSIAGAIAPHRPAKSAPMLSLVTMPHAPSHLDLVTEMESYVRFDMTSYALKFGKY